MTYETIILLNNTKISTPIKLNRCKFNKFYTFASENAFSKSEYYTNLIQNCKGNPEDFCRELKKSLPASKYSIDISNIEIDGVSFTSAINFVCLKLVLC